MILFQKRAALLIGLLTSVTISLLAQDTLSRKGGYFTVFKKNNSVGQTIAVGDKVVITLKDKKLVQGKMVEANRDYILIDSKGKIEITNIKWIRKNKAPTGLVVSGIVITAVGIALLVPVFAGTVDFDAIVPLGGVGIAAIISGISFLTPPKYKLQKGDKIIYKE